MFWYKKGGPRKMKKKNSTIPFTKKWKKVFYKSLVFILCSLIFISWSLGQESKKYPPYPDVWGYEFPWPGKGDRDSSIKVNKVPNGDFLVTYVKKRSKVKEVFKNEYEGVYFFSAKKIMFRSEDNYFNFLAKISEGKTGEYNVVLKEGSKVESINKRNPMTDRCPHPFEDRYLLIRDSKAEIISKKFIVYIYDTPYKDYLGNEKYCERNESYPKDYIFRKVDNVRAAFVQLEDNTFLLFDMRGNFIIRFDNSLFTKSNLINNKVFLIERDLYEKIVSKLKETHDQAINDALENYLIKLRKEVSHEIHRGR